MLDAGTANETQVRLLRSIQWLQGVVIGGVIPLDLPEMSVVGAGTVTAILDCPQLESGPGRLVTGWFAHKRGRILESQIEGESTALHPTATHPFWSVDRGDWTPAGQLEIGETLLTLLGFSKVLSLTPCEEPVPVYNLEVEGDHVYRVGQSGVLVHNMSQPNPGGVQGHSPCGCPGTPGGTPATPPSGNTNPPPPRPNVTCDELTAIVTASGTASSVTTGGHAGGALIRLIAERGLNQNDTAAQIEEGRDFIHWFFGPGSWNFDRVTGSTGTAIIFEGAPAMAGKPFPVLAVHSDGRIFSGQSDLHLILSGGTTTFDFDWNTVNATEPSYKKIKLFDRTTNTWIEAA